MVVVVSVKPESDEMDECVLTTGPFYYFLNFYNFF